MLIKGKKGDVELSLKTIVGIVIGIGGLVIFFIIASSIIGIFFFSNQCKASADNLDFIKFQVDKVIESGVSETQFVSLNDKCALVGFNRFGSNIVDKPKICGLDGCLCLCQFGITNIPKCIDKKEYCALYSNVDYFNGNYNHKDLKNQLYLTGINVLNISKNDKTITILIIEDKNSENGGEFDGG